MGITNSKTKKLLIQLLNQIPTPISLVSKKGQVLFCNVQFEHMLRTRLGSKGMPASIFKLTNEDEGSHQKLQKLVDDAIKPSGVLNP